MFVYVLRLSFYSVYKSYRLTFFFTPEKKKKKMLVGTVGPATARHVGGAGGGRTGAARPPSSSSSSDSVALPARLVSGRATRCVGRVSDDDFETSSYEETTESSFTDDNSEEFVPLAFGYINDHPKRYAGTPARTQGPTGASEEVGSQSSFSEASPLEVFFERASAKRNYGKGARYTEEDEVTTSLSSFDDDDASAVSDALPVEFERKMKTRGVGKAEIETYEVSDSESAISLSDEDEAPLNAQLIYTLVKRLRNPLDEVTPEAFDYLDFNDANFREVLEPLKQIKASIERRASYPMKQNKEIEKEIRAAVQSLPSQKAIAVKMQMVKSRQLKAADGLNGVCLGGESSSAEAVDKARTATVLAPPEEAKSAAVCAVPSHPISRSLTNGQDILELIKRLKDDDMLVPLRAFDELEWNDRNFARELEPLQQIRVYMEAREVARGMPGEKSISSVPGLEVKIRTAILALPPEKAVAVKIQMLKERDMASEADKVKPQAAIVGEMAAPAGTMRKMRDSVLFSGQSKKRKAKEGQLSASTSQVMQVGAKVMSSHHRKYRAKESNALSEPARPVRRLRNTASRNVSFLKVEDAAPGEIVDQDQVLAEISGPQRLRDDSRSSPAASVTPRDIPRVPSRPAKGLERRPRNHRPGNSAVSFSELPKQAEGAVVDEEERLAAAAKRKPQRRRAAHKPGRNLSISSLPDLEAKEMVEEPVLPDKPAAREVAVPTAPARPPTKPQGSTKKRRVRTNGNNRYCSFSEVALDEAAEVPDANAGTLKGAAGEPETARAGGDGGNVVPPKKTRKLVRRRKPGEEGGTPALEENSPGPEKKREVEATTEGKLKPPSRGKGRRANIPHPRNANASMVEDEAIGEIVELQQEVQRLYTPSGKSTPGPERASTARAPDRDMTAASRTPRIAQMTKDIASALRKRRQRLHVSKELSVSAVPDDVPGEIVEDERDTLAVATPAESLDLQSNGGGRTVPLMANASWRRSMQYADRPNSSVRSSTDRIRVGLPPNAEPSVMPDAADTSYLPPAQGVRRSAEPALRPAKLAVKSADGGTYIPALRASR